MAMGTKENTAVNRLVELAGSKPIDDGADDLFAAPKPVPRPAKKPTPPPPFRASQPMTAQKAPEGTPTPELLRSRPADDDIDIDEQPVVQTSTAVVQPLPRPAIQPGPAIDDPWFEPSGGHDKHHDHDDLFASTHGIRKRGSGAALWWVAGAFGLGLSLAALMFWPGDDKAKKKKAAAPPAAAAAAPVAAAEPAPAPTPEPVAAAVPAPAPEVAPAPVAEPAVAPEPAPSVEPIAVPEPAPVTPSVVTIRFESRPAGASVVLVEDGQTIPLGTAPVERRLDPSKRYEVMFSLEGHASVILPVEPASGGTLWATLASAKGGAAPAVAVEEPEETKPEPKAAPKVEKKREAKVPEAPKKKAEKKAEPKKVAAKPEKDKPEARADGKGTLQLAAKPPCEIIIDGRKTGLTTPQRDLDLPAGKHKVTLINKEHGIKEAFSVTVKAGQSTRVVKDLTRKMK
jgi:outer membrane biosynthesis protein TonB